MFVENNFLKANLFAYSSFLLKGFACCLTWNNCFWRANLFETMILIKVSYKTFDENGLSI